MANVFLVANESEESAAVFDARFSRCSRLLHFIAFRVLDGPERAGDAVENCRLRASRYPPRFEYEGAFRSWLVRVLIDEALAILRESQENPQDETALRARFYGALNQFDENELYG